MVSARGSAAPASLSAANASAALLSDRRPVLLIRYGTSLRTKGSAPAPSQYAPASRHSRLSASGRKPSISRGSRATPRSASRGERPPSPTRRPSSSRAVSDGDDGGSGGGEVTFIGI